MLRSRRLHRYQRFLKTLRRSDSRRCFCPVHIHPRPWVPPPCRTTRPYGVDGIQAIRRFHSNPESARDRKLTSVDMDEDYEIPDSIQYLYNDARILKDALHTIRHGDQLSKDAYNTVKKWSDQRIPEAEDMLEKKKQRRKQRKEEEEEEAAGEDKTAARREEELRAELRTLRDLNQSNEALLQVNRKLKRKVQKLQQRIKREEVAGKGSRESVAQLEANTRDDYIFLSLKKKYDDLLQYALKVESENQKLKSLAGMSGEQEGWYNDSERENIGTAQGAVAALRSQVQELRTELARKDEYIVKCEQHLQTLKDNMAVQDSLRGQTSEQGERRTTARGPEVAVLEQEWTRRLIETKETYDRAIQEYKNQLSLLQEKVEAGERDHHSQVQKLTELLAREQERRTQAEKTLESKQKQGHDENREKQEYRKDKNQGNGEDKERQGHEKDRENKGQDEERERQGQRGEREVAGHGENRRTVTDDIASDRDASEAERGDKYSKLASISKSEKSDSPRRPPSSKDRKGNGRIMRSTSLEGDGGIDTNTTVAMEGAERYREALDLIVKRLENLQMSRDWVETTVSVVKDTISQCLQEWRESLEQQQIQWNSQVEQLNAHNTELQKRWREKNKKVESLVKQCSELEQENTKLTHQCALGESRVAAAQASAKLEGLQGLPQKLQELEEALIDSKELLHKAQVEKQALQDQVRQLAEKLSKKEAKLRIEREQSAGRGDEASGLREAVASHKQMVEDTRSDMGLLREQLATKDVLLEQMSAQLEERIRECAHLASQVERYKLKQDQETESFQVRLHEWDSTSHKQLLEAQAQASRYQTQLSTLRSEKEQSEKALRCHNRKLEERLDQLQLKNATLERQLKTITSTFNSMFSTVDLNPPISGVPGTSGL
ncbi:hypothetical protein Pcinc_016784 [Petrolisthes cinctipes]|uniref:Outer dense fiber protein 2-like n=1 Tax=Petrolisthes cinctipes TaxID=88211 RepID=A0AAE1KLF5_PETCI|nr:hypothetical protein Pcinc_016784 [Petrolisthes cinctipes]